MIKTTLVDLPVEILVQIFTHVDDIWSLVGIASTCKALNGVICSDDQYLWKAIHKQHYDNPAEACAFPEPRTSYDWRAQVIERQCVFRFLYESCDSLINDVPKAQYKWFNSWVFQPKQDQDRDSSRNDLGGIHHSVWRLSDAVRLWSKRVAKVALDVYTDLPSSSKPSKNAMILGQLSRLASFKFCLFMCKKVDPKQNALICALDLKLTPFGPAERFPRNDHCRLKNFTITLQRSAHERSDFYGFESPTLVNWLATDNGCGPTPRPQYVPDLYCPQGHFSGLGGILGVMDDDWAGASGRWSSWTGLPRVCSDHMSTPVAAGYESQRNKFHSSFTLAVAESRTLISSCFESQSQIPINILWGHFPKIRTDSLPPRFPPLYFYSQSLVDTNFFVYGVVQLSLDSPPELVWTFSSQHVIDEKIGTMLQGVEVGGRGSPFGIVGRWGPRDYGPAAFLPTRDRRLLETAVVQAAPDEAFRPWANDSAAWCWRAED